MSVHDPSDTTQQALLHRVMEDVRDLNATLKDDYVLLVVFNGYQDYVDQRMKPLERLVYGLVGLVLTGFITALVAVAINSQ